ncbi:hypothetical protein C8R44DRAFT_973975 [Mycena epipterygia]|nr:hypothetical protein C8R44DRAFT_973975 [Mycena epipterygia]
MDFPENSPPEVWQVLSDARTTNSMILGALSLVAYDHLITLPDEVELMWKSGISTTNTVYLWNRYFTLIALSYDASGRSSLIQYVPVLSTLVAPELIFAPFTPGVHQILPGRGSDIHVDPCNRGFHLGPPSLDFVWKKTGAIVSAGADDRIGSYDNVGDLHSLSFRVFTGSRALVSHYTIASVKEYWDLPWPLTGCYPHGNVPRYFAFYSVPVLVVSMTMFLMTAYKCGKTLLTRGRAQMPIYNMFLRDGIFWFVAIFVTFIPEVVIWARARQTLAELLIAPGLAITSIIGSRVLLNIKRLKLAKVLPTTATATALGTTIELDTIDYPSRIPWGTVGTTDGANLTITDVP